MKHAKRLKAGPRMKKMIVDEIRHELARYTDEKYMVDAGQFEKGSNEKEF